MAELRAPEGANKKKIIVGRGKAAKRGRTAGRGHDGQNSRSGGGVRPGFEGGQMPLYRRIARRGFSNYPFRVEYETVNIDIIEVKFNDGDTVNRESLLKKGLISKKRDLVKVLGNGEITKKLTFDVDKITKGAAEKISKAGGTIVEKSEKSSTEGKTEAEQEKKSEE